MSSLTRAHSSTWEATQETTFTRWLNIILQKHFKGLVIKNLSRAFCDGIVLFKLIQALHPEVKLPSYNKKPRSRIHRLDNASLALSVAYSTGWVLPSTNARHLVDGDTKMVLGMVWAVVQAHQLRSITVDQSTGKEGLLLWAKRRTAGYRGVPEVSNFTKDWASGLAFAALLHYHRPELLDYDRLYEEHRDDPLTCLRQAFDAAERGLGVPQLLDAETVANAPRPDERSIITYVSVVFERVAAHAAAAAGDDPAGGGDGVGGHGSSRSSSSAKPAVTLASLLSPRNSGAASAAAAASAMASPRGSAGPAGLSAAAGGSPRLGHDAASPRAGAAGRRATLGTAPPTDQRRLQLTQALSLAVRHLAQQEAQAQFARQVNAFEARWRPQSKDNKGDGAADDDLLSSALALLQQGRRSGADQCHEETVLRVVREWNEATATAAPPASSSTDPAADSDGEDTLSPEHASAVATLEEVALLCQKDQLTKELAAELLYEFQVRADALKWAAGHLKVDLAALEGNLRQKLSGGGAGPSPTELAGRIVELHIETWPLLANCEERDLDEEQDAVSVVASDNPDDGTEQLHDDDERFFADAERRVDRYADRLAARRLALADLDQKWTALQAACTPSPTDSRLAGILGALQATMEAIHDKASRSATAHELAARLLQQSKSLCQNMRGLGLTLARDTLAEPATLATMSEEELREVSDRFADAVERAGAALDKSADALSSARDTAADLEGTGEAPRAALQAQARVELLLCGVEELIASRTRAAQVDQLLLGELSQLPRPESVATSTTSTPASTLTESRESLRRMCTAFGGLHLLSGKSDAWLDEQVLLLAGRREHAAHWALSPGGVLRVMALAQRDLGDRQKLQKAFAALATTTNCCIEMDQLRQKLPNLARSRAQLPKKNVPHINNNEHSASAINKLDVNSKAVGC